MVLVFGDARFSSGLASLWQQYEQHAHRCEEEDLPLSVLCLQAAEQSFATSTKY